MSDNTGAGNPSGGIGWRALAAATMAIAVVADNSTPFVHSRPEVTTRAQSVKQDARLWEDPLANGDDVLSRHLSAADMRTVKQIVLVQVPGTSRPATVSYRCKTRHALHTAASTSSFGPVNADKRELLVPPIPVSLLWNSSGQEDAAASWTPLLLNVERFEPDLPPSAKTDPTERRTVLVAWVPAEMKRQRLNLVAGLLSDAAENDSGDNVPTLLVGPSSTFAAERLFPSDNRTKIDNIDHVLSPWVTSDFPIPSPKTSYIFPDQKLAGLLHEELARRMVTSASQVLLILERDSTYARTWRGHLSTAFGGQADAFKTIYYSRGIDGEHRIDRAAARRTASSTMAAVEQPTGPSQLDYFRRLRNEIALKEHFTNIRAVGIFGDDIHDKLLALQAMRPVMPQAIYFTSDLDAYYLHSREQAHTRNLLVASGHGLTPTISHGSWRRHGVDTAPPKGDAPPTPPVVAPFRDSYQTSSFLAFQGAFRWPAPNVHANSVEPGQVTAAEGDGKRSEPSQPEEANDRDEESIVYEPTTTQPQQGHVYEVGINGAFPTDQATKSGTALWGMLALLGTVLICWITNRIIRSDYDVQVTSWPTRRQQKVAIAGFAMLCAATWVGMRHSDECLRWLEGISIWPTDLFRLLALGMSCVFARKMIYEIHQSIRELQQDTPRSLPLYLLRAVGLKGFVPSANHLEDATSRTKEFTRSALWTALLLVGVTAAIVIARGWVRPPTRGAWAMAWDTIIKLLAIWAMIWLVLLVIEFARLQAVLCQKLQRTIPELVRIRGFGSTLDRIATAGGQGLYGPFVVILLLTLGRLDAFDRWTWPAALVGLLVTCATSMVVAHAVLHKQAMGLKRKGMEHLRAQIAGRDDAPSTLVFKLNEIEKMNHGILAGPGNHPILVGLLIPFTGIGGVSLLHLVQKLSM